MGDWAWGLDCSLCFVCWCAESVANAASRGSRHAFVNRPGPKPFVWADSGSPSWVFGLCLSRRLDAGLGTSNWWISWVLTSQCCRDEIEVARVAADAAVQEVVSQDVLADFWVHVWSLQSAIHRLPAVVPAHWWSGFLRGPARERHRP